MGEFDGSGLVSVGLGVATGTSPKRYEGLRLCVCCGAPLNSYNGGARCAPCHRHVAIFCPLRQKTLVENALV